MKEEHIKPFLIMVIVLVLSLMPLIDYLLKGV
jgi:hypothetical protein